MPERACFSATAEMLQAYKIKILNDISDGRLPVSHDGSPIIDVPAELLLWLVERAQLWVRLEHDERVHQGNEA